MYMLLFHFQTSGKITRIIICSGKQALNQSKFHPPSKQPIAAHLPPSLKHPNRAALGPRHSPPATRNPAARRSALRGPDSKHAQHQAPGTAHVKTTRGEEEVRGRGRGQGTEGATTFSTGLMHLQVDPILSSDFTPRNTTYVASQD